MQESVAEEAKQRIPIAQGLPSTIDKPQVISELHRLNSFLKFSQSILAVILFIANNDILINEQNLPKPPVKEQTKPLNIKLHTEQRAARRAGFNNLVRKPPMDLKSSISLISHEHANADHKRFRIESCQH